MPSINAKNQQRQVGAALSSLGRDATNYLSQSRRFDFIREQEAQRQLQSDLQDAETADAVAGGALLIQGMKKPPMGKDGQPLYSEEEEAQAYAETLGVLSSKAPRQVPNFIEAHRRVQAERARAKQMPQLQDEMGYALARGYIDEGKAQAYAQMIQEGQPLSVVQAAVTQDIGAGKKAETDALFQQQEMEVDQLLLTEWNPGGSDLGEEKPMYEHLGDLHQVLKDRSPETRIALKMAIIQDKTGKLGAEFINERKALKQAQEEAKRAKYGMQVLQALDGASQNDPASIAMLDALGVPQEAMDDYMAARSGKPAARRKPKDTQGTAPQGPPVAGDRIEAMNDIALLLGQLEQAVAQAETPEAKARANEEGSAQLQALLDNHGLTEQQAQQLLQEMARTGGVQPEPEPFQWFSENQGQHPSADFGGAFPDQKQRLRNK